MANAKKCDRCGKLYEDKRKYPIPQIKIVDEFSANNRKAYFELDTLDMCYACKSSFFEWLQEVKKNGKEEENN